MDSVRAVFRFVNDRFRLSEAETAGIHDPHAVPASEASGGPVEVGDGAAVRASLRELLELLDLLDCLWHGTNAACFFGEATPGWKSGHRRGTRGCCRPVEA